MYGVGLIVAAQLIGYAGDLRRFSNGDAKLRLLRFPSFGQPLSLSGQIRR